jgi:hypothetical protein
MSAAATRIGATVPRVLYPEPWSGRQDWTRFASGDRLKREAKHLAAVARTLHWADEAAERGDHFDAVAWLETLEAIGDQLPEVYESRRRSWSAQIARTRATTKPPSHPVPKPSRKPIDAPAASPHER